MAGLSRVWDGCSRIGGSTRPKEMEEPAAGRAALVRSREAARDIGAVVDSIRDRRRVEKVVLFGWSTGGNGRDIMRVFTPRK